MMFPLSREFAKQTGGNPIATNRQKAGIVARWSTVAIGIPRSARNFGEKRKSAAKGSS
jgi:hypothetical protein